jgi:hypothetical protein
MCRVSRLIYLFGIAIAIDTSDCCDAQSEKPKEQEVYNMTKKEESCLRQIVDEGISTHVRDDTRSREVVLRDDLVKLHKAKRISVVKALLEIVKDGQPANARTAVVTIIALERGWVPAVAYADVPLDTFDEVGGGNRTDRQKLLDLVTKLSAEAEKEIQSSKEKK